MAGRAALRGHTPRGIDGLFCGWISKPRGWDSGLALANLRCALTISFFPTDGWLWFLSQRSWLVLSYKDLSFSSSNSAQAPVEQVIALSAVQDVVLLCAAAFRLITAERVYDIRSPCAAEWQVQILKASKLVKFEDFEVTAAKIDFPPGQFGLVRVARVHNTHPTTCHLPDVVAFKCLRLVPLLLESERIDTFLQEIELIHTADIEHAHIVRFFEIKLADFGSARCLASGQLVTDRNVDVGTPGYAPKEVIEGRPWGHSIDVYGLGVVLFELLHRRRAFLFEGSPLLRDADLAAHIAQGLPPPPVDTLTPLAEHLQATQAGLVRAISQCFSASPSDRPNAAQLAALVAQAGTDYQRRPPPPLWLAKKIEQIKARREDQPLRGVVMMPPAAAAPDVRPATAPQPLHTASQPDSYEFDVFVSYRRETEEVLAESVVDLLEGRHQLHVFLDKDKLRAGEDWRKRYLAALKSSRVFLPLFSRRSLSSTGPFKGIQNVTPDGPIDSCLQEYEIALDLELEKKTVVVPVGVHEDATDAQGHSVVRKFDCFGFAAECPSSGSPSRPGGNVQETMRRIFSKHFHQLEPGDREAKARLAEYVAGVVHELKNQAREKLSADGGNGADGDAREK
eukprot:m.134579 g.134579  ORF g.134579 m.134579 type:complete len:623 (+) comp20139_c0_seq5:75-1943(+)